MDMSLNSVHVRDKKSKKGNDKRVVSGHVGNIAPENQSTTVGYRHQMDVVDASRVLQSIGVMRTYYGKAFAVPLALKPGIHLSVHRIGC